MLTGWLYHAGGIECDARAMAWYARHRGCCGLSAKVVELNRRCGLSGIFELADPRFEESDVLLEQTRAGDFGTCCVLAIVGSVVGNAPTTGGFVSVAFLQRFVNDEGFQPHQSETRHTALSLRQGRHAAPLFSGRLDEEDSVDMLEMCGGCAMRLRGLRAEPHRTWHRHLIYEDGISESWRRFIIRGTSAAWGCAVCRCREGMNETQMSTSRVDSKARKTGRSRAVQ